MKGLVLLSLLLMACSADRSKVHTQASVPAPHDVHSYAQPQAAKIIHLDLDIEVQFTAQTITGAAIYQIEKAVSATEIILDINDIEIDSVWIISEDQSTPTAYQITEAKPFMGSALHIQIDSITQAVGVQYKTRPGAAAIQWLSPKQTLGKLHPFLFTQGQAILTRTWLPCQDSPGIRFTYSAKVAVPSHLMAVMSAENPQEKAEDGIYNFTMEQPIPAYLMALAVGDLSFASLGPRTGVYAEPGMIDASQYEFADLEKMLVAAESLYGPYLWGRYDLIVLPPSFPFGGMENPKLTFATPTIVAGDRSLTSLVAHELAHSWSGNLVTNATWDDFWINEGHTVYIERRIMESLYSSNYSEMLALLGFQDLLSTIEDLDARDTQLKLSLADRDPDEGMTDVAYEKGYLLLRTLEESVGREAFDEYLRKYFDDYKFQSISTAQWKAYVTRNLLVKHRISFDLDAWLHGTGLPESHATITSDKFEYVNTRLREFRRIARLDRSNTRNWSTHEWLHFIRGLPIDLHRTFYEKLDNVYDLSESGNAEILAAWLELSIRSNYLGEHNTLQLKSFLIQIGRRKFLTPLYRALIETDRKELAVEIFEMAKENYHSVSRNSIEALLENSPNI